MFRILQKIVIVSFTVNQTLTVLSLPTVYLLSTGSGVAQESRHTSKSVETMLPHCGYSASWLVALCCVSEVTCPQFLSNSAMPSLLCSLSGVLEYAFVTLCLMPVGQSALLLYSSLSCLTGVGLRALQSGLPLRCAIINFYDKNNINNA